MQIILAHPYDDRQPGDTIEVDARTGRRLLALGAGQVTGPAPEPTHVGGGWYDPGDGSRVRGLDAAEDAAE